MTQSDTTATHIAIVGMAGRLPGARTIDEFWQNLCRGEESIRRLSMEEMIAAGLDPGSLEDPHHVPYAALIDDIDLFDASFFGVSGREAELMDPQQRLFLECAWEALETAGCDPSRFEGAIGTFGGENFDSYLTKNLLPADVFEDKAAVLQTILSNDKDYLATRVAYKLNLRGPAFTVQSGCSTSLLAVHLASQSLLNYECDLALAGGVAIDIGRGQGYWSHEGSVSSPDGRCRAFGADARGTVFGNGVAVVALKRLADAVDDGDTIHAVVIGSAVNNDGAAKVGFTAPSVTGQAAVVAEALADAGVTADSIGYIEAHGTGTALGDPIEIEALTKAFGPRLPGTARCAIGSVKSNLGHLDSAAGVTGLIKAALSLHHGLLPASLHASAPNPTIRFERTPFFVNGALTPWTAGTRPGVPRRAGVSSFGMGGTNVHVVLQEAPARTPDPGHRTTQLLVWSARTPEALEAATLRLHAALSVNSPPLLEDIAYTLQVGRGQFAHRRTLVTGSIELARAAMAEPDDGRVRTRRHDGSSAAVAFLFPGQGFQYAGMARDLYESEPLFRDAFDACNVIIQSLGGVDLTTRVFVAPGTRSEAADAALVPTDLAQPAIFAVEYALARLWMGWGVQPAAMLGHSLGEYVAACLAGVFSLADALRIVVVRGRLMQELPAGAMVAVAAPANALTLDGGLGLAAVNGDDRTVVAGPTEEVTRLVQVLTADGIACRQIRTSHACHSPMVTAAMQPFVQAFNGIRLSPPEIRFVSNVSGRWIEPEEATSPDYWAEHLRRTVRFADGVRCLAEDGPYHLLEVGPGRALVTLARRSDPDGGRLMIGSLPTPGESATSDTTMLDALGQLWQAGVSPDWQAVQGGRRARVSLPTYPFDRARFWVDPPDDKDPVAVTAAAASVARRENPAEWFYVPGWTQTPAAELVGGGPIDIAAARWLIFADDSALSREFLRRMQDVVASDRVAVVRPGASLAQVDAVTFTIDPASREDYAHVIAALTDAGRRPTHVIHLWAVRDQAQADLDSEDVRRAQDWGSFGLVELTRALEAEGSTARVSIRIVTNHVHDVLGTESLSLEAATLSGVARVIPQELPHVDCGCIDLDLPGEMGPSHARASTLAERLVVEVTNWMPEPQVAYRGNSRWVPSYAAITPARRATTSLRASGTYVILGGLGRIGLSLAEHLVRTVRAHVVLVGRTPLPGRDVWETWVREHGEGDPVSQRIRRISAIESLGADVLLVTADVSDVGELGRAFEAAEGRFGAVHGVIAAAGIVDGAFRAITALTPEEFERQFRPKVEGLFALERVLASRSVDFCVVVSSLSSILGGLGYGAYAAANAFMDAFVRRHNRSSGQSWVSVDWDAWRWTEVDSKAPGAALARLAMTPEEATRVFDAVLSYVGHVDQLVISTTDLHSRIEQWVEFVGSRQTAEPVVPDWASSPANDAEPTVEPDDRPLTPTQRAVVEVWAHVLGLPRVELHEGFLDIGGSSLTAVQAISRLEQRLGVHVAIEEFIFQTAAQLAGLCDRKLEAQASVQVAEPPPTRGLLRSLRSAVTGKR